MNHEHIRSASHTREAFQRTAAVDLDAVALRTPGGAQSLTWREYADQVRQVVAGLAGLGVERGDTVSLMMANRPILSARGRRPTRRRHLVFGLQHPARRAVGVPVRQRRHQGDHVRGAVRRADPRQRRRDRPHCLPRRLARRHHDGRRPRCRRRRRFRLRGVMAGSAIRRCGHADLHVGTTGNPKGVEITHANLLFQAFAIDEVSVCIRRPDHSFLPTAHIADRWRAVVQGSSARRSPRCPTESHCGSAADVRPTMWGAVPRVWEKFKAAIEFAAANEQTRRSGWACSGGWA